MSVESPTLISAVRQITTDKSAWVIQRAEARRADR